MAVVWMLRVGWIAGTLPFVAASKITAFHNLLRCLVGRGKIINSSSKKLSVPKKFSRHFYLLGFIWTTLLLVTTWLYAYESAPIISESLLYSSIASHLTGVSHEFSFYKSPTSVGNYKHGIWNSVFLLLLMEAQVLRCLFDSIYIFKYSPSARMHIVGYLTGLFFYTAAPLSLCCTHSSEVFKYMANLSAEFIVKGKEIMQVDEFDLWSYVNPLLHLKWYAWIGGAVFFWGWIRQKNCHAVLGSLREDDQMVDHYAIPHGDWFEYISSPHYLAEIVMYGGFVIASGFSDITIWLLFGFVVANLAFAAVETQKWYLAKFDNYPRNRYAIVPFVC